MIPISFSSKIGIYEIEQQGVRIRARVVDSPVFLDTYISQFRSSLAKPVVGLDVKSTSYYPKLLILYAGTECLVIQSAHTGALPDNLKRFLADENICFVGANMSQTVSYLQSTPYSLTCKTGVQVGELAAKVLKKPSLLNSSIIDLAREIELSIDFEIPKTGSALAGTNWSAKVFSHEQIKYAIQDAYAAYAIAFKLLSTL